MQLYPSLAEREQPEESRIQRNTAGKFVLPEGREDYVPTPLDPNNVVGPGGRELYTLGSLDKIGSLVEKLRVTSEHPDWLLDIIHHSLMASHQKRCVQNSDALAWHGSTYRDAPFSDEFSEIYDCARAGVATMPELMALAHEPHGLRAIELAKLSHPLDWEATYGMDTAVNFAIEEFDTNADFRERSAHRRYKFHRADLDGNDNLRALVVSRKRDVALLKDQLLVVKRSTLVLRFDDELGDDQQFHPQFTSLIKAAMHDAKTEPPRTGEDKDDAYRRCVNDAINAAAPEYIEPMLALASIDKPDCIAPTATSYYCKAVNRAELTYQTPAQRAASESLGLVAVAH